jgi:hypothetical protein
MSTAIRRTPFVGFAHLVALASCLALPCSVSQDRQEGTNAGRDEDDIRQLISMYAKGQMKPIQLWRHASGATYRKTHLSTL